MGADLARGVRWRGFNLVAGAAAVEPAHTEHVGGGAEGAIAEAVFADPVNARAMIDWHFSDAIAHVADEGRDKAVHAVE